MPVDYKKLWILMIEKEISKPQLRQKAKLSPATLTKLNKNEYVSMDVFTLDAFHSANVIFNGLTLFYRVVTNK